jgi:hypothetical protein
MPKNLRSNAASSLILKAPAFSTPGASLAPGSETELWEPPFERWIRLADHLLTGWTCESDVPARATPSSES